MPMVLRAITSVGGRTSMTTLASEFAERFRQFENSWEKEAEVWRN